jgi:hypothetical protein
LKTKREGVKAMKNQNASILQVTDEFDQIIQSTHKRMESGTIDFVNGAGKIMLHGMLKSFRDPVYQGLQEQLTNALGGNELMDDDAEYPESAERIVAAMRKRMDHLFVAIMRKNGADWMAEYFMAKRERSRTPDLG